jgi:hypothetical protein
MKVISLRDRIAMMDWRIVLGVFVTTLWIAFGLIYLEYQPKNLLNMHIDELGGFLEGAFAPLAFMWLVIGLFIQQKELADNTEVMRQSMLQAQQQAEAMAALEMNARQEAFFKIADNVKKELGVIAGMQFISAFGSTEGNIVAEERIRELLAEASTGDDEAFVREFLSVNVPLRDDRARVFYGTEIRRRHSMTFRDTFERLLSLAEKCDTDQLIVGTVTHTAFGLYYNLLVRHEPEAAGRFVDPGNVVAPVPRTEINRGNS